VKKIATKMTESKTEVPSSSTLKVRKAATKLPDAIQPDSVSAHPLADVSDEKARRKPKLETVPIPVPVPVPAPLPDVAPKSVTLPDVPVPHVLVRSARPSSRLVQLTVPSMAQSVASNAAKASFTRMTSLEPITPPMVGMIKKDNKLAHNWKKKPVQDLTDADVLAMPDDEYMNDTQLAFFRLKLVKLKTDMLSNAGETSEHLREETVIVPDPTDRATIEEEHALELRTRDRERKLLKKIDQSIASVDAGTYGFCEETGENIGVGRLLARPTAHLSLEAQQRRELKQKMFGD
jgi:DnaK suppressor protein